MHTERIGTGSKHVVVLHGWGHNLEAMRPLSQSISSGDVTIHLIDLPGFGKSPAPTSTWSSFDYADAIYEYLKDYPIEQVSFVGHSFGGKVSISFASKYPHLTDRLVLIAASGLKPMRGYQKTVRLKLIRMLGKGSRLLDKVLTTNTFEKFSKRFASADYRKAGVMRPILVQSVNEDLTTVIQGLRMPVLLLWGEQDSETPMEMAQRMHRYMSQSRLIAFPNKGHALPLDVGGHLCARYINPFLKEALHG